MTGVEVRKVETVRGETGVGVEDRVDAHYELGAEIDGVWVPFAAVREGRVEVLKERSARLAARAAAAKPAAAKAKTAKPAA